MTLPPLKVGQIWQCQDQTNRVKITRPATAAENNTWGQGAGGMMVGLLFRQDQEVPTEVSGNYYQGISKYEMYLRAMRPAKTDPTNLVVLLYDPEDA